MNAIDTAIAWVRARHDEFLEEYKELLAIPSVSTLPEHKDDVLRTARWLADRLAKAGMSRGEVMPTPGHPVVYAEWLGAPGKPTVLVYGHYDVQPVDPIDEWLSDPFRAEVRDDYVYARGASDMKGQFLCHLKAIEALAAQGDFPVNLKYLLEGEEEIGSPSLPGFVAAHRDRLACDFVLNCDASIYAPDQPSIVYALRGLAYFELEVRNAEKDLHSGLFGGTVRNPIHILSELVAGMHDADGRVTLPGFYDRVLPLEAEERAALEQVPHSDEAWMKLAGVRALHGETGYTTIERMGARPCLDVNGIWGGFTGKGAKTVLPAKACAKLSVRLVPAQDPQEVESQLRAYLDARMPEGAEYALHAHSWGAGAVMDRTSPAMQAAVKALEEVFWPRSLLRAAGRQRAYCGVAAAGIGCRLDHAWFRPPRRRHPWPE